jgi:hypothetical protein
MARIQKIPTGEFSPFYGCAIMSLAALTFGGIIAFSAYSLFSQDKAIAVFASDTPIKLPPIELSPEARAALEKKLTDFASTAKTGQPAELTLSISDLNALILIAPDTGYGTYTDLVRLESFDPAKSTVSGQVSLPMNNVKFWENKKRYLNGQITFHLYIHAEGIDAKVVDVKVPGKEVAEGFITGMEIWPWVAPYRKVEPVGATLKAIQKVTVTAEAVTFSNQP